MGSADAALAMACCRSYRTSKVACGTSHRVVHAGTPASNIVFTGQFYALAAIAGTSLYVLLIRTSVNTSLARWMSVADVFASGPTRSTATGRS
jgi:hypothetical protein